MHAAKLELTNSLLVDRSQTGIIVRTLYKFRSQFFLYSPVKLRFLDKSVSQIMREMVSVKINLEENGIHLANYIAEQL